MLMTTRHYSLQHQWPPRSAGAGYLHIVKFFFLRGQDINFVNRSGQTALMYVVYFRREEVVHYLSKNVRIDQINENGQTALDEALRMGHREIVTELSVPAVTQPLLNINIEQNEQSISADLRALWQRGAAIPTAFGPLVCAPCCTTRASVAATRAELAK
uniref:ANK_REP_REGION domain-containing protein n=1 Tax=Globodera pallida TaxID=36090 RepID=A0A183BL51_GLOPA